MMKIIIGIIVLASIFLFASSKGMRNVYSITLLIIIDLLVFAGCSMVYLGNFAWGIPIALLAVPLMAGFKNVQGANPKKVGLVTYFGKRTESVVEGLTLVLDWPFDIISFVEFSAQLEDMDFPITSVRSKDGVRFEGMLSVGTQADEEKLDKFDDAKGMTGIKSQLDEVVLSWLQEIVGQEDRSWKWVEQNPIEIQRIIYNRLTNPGANNDNSLVNASELGCKFKKISLKLKPVSTKIIEADEDATVETLQRKAELLDTETINLRAKMRLAEYEEHARKNPGVRVPTLQQCIQEVKYETLMKQGNVKITEGGKVLTLQGSGQQP